MDGSAAPAETWFRIGGTAARSLNQYSRHYATFPLDGNTHTWTLEAPLPAQRAQVDGQANLFEAL